MTGLFVPIATLAGFGFASIAASMGKKAGMVVALVILLSLPTNLILFLILQHGIQSHDPMLYLTRGEAQAMAWIEKNTPQDALILAAPGTSLFIPAYTGRRVLYGHPFETVDAARQKTAVMDFFQDGEAVVAPPAEFLTKNGVDFILFGPRERQLGALPAGIDLILSYSKEGTELYQVLACRCKLTPQPGD